jgi:hypothetical protein
LIRRALEYKLAYFMQGKKSLIFFRHSEAIMLTLDGICSQLSSNVDRAGQPALKDILLHLQEKLISKREMEKQRLTISDITQT